MKKARSSKEPEVRGQRSSSDVLHDHIDAPSDDSRSYRTGVADTLAEMLIGRVICETSELVLYCFR